MTGALALAQDVQLLYCEQPLLNYLIVTSGLRYDSLLSIARETGAWFDIPQERWGGAPSIVVRDGRDSSKDTHSDDALG